MAACQHLFRVEFTDLTDLRRYFKIKKIKIKKYRCIYLYTHIYIPTNIPTCKLPIYLYALPNCYIYNDIPGGRFVFTVTPGGFVPFVGLLLNKADGIPGGVEAGVFTFV